MPAEIVSLNGETVTRETKLPIRYAYNYCTLSYSMAFWGEEEWRNELDWLALNGVNAVLDATAQVVISSVISTSYLLFAKFSTSTAGVLCTRVPLASPKTIILH